MASNEIHKNDIGTVFKVTIKDGSSAVDIYTSTTKQLIFKKHSGQKLEANNINHIGLGTANCQSFTISFYVKSSVTGVYSISVTNNASNLAYPVQYTINSADTWERKTMTIPPITSGTWEVGTGVGIVVVGATVV